MDKSKKRLPKNQTRCSTSEEVSSIEWEFIDISEQEEDIINRMHKLVGDKWGLIAGRVPGRKAEEIERFWLMKYNQNFKDKNLLSSKQHRHQQRGRIGSDRIGSDHHPKIN